jgi:hypothetical protein
MIEVSSALKVQRRWRTRSRLLQRYGPYFFAQRSGEPAAFGTIKFVGDARRSVRKGSAEWVRVASEEFALRPHAFLLLMEQFWRLPTPDLLISVTGAAKNIQLDQTLAKKFAQGLSNVLHATEAWVITAGTQHGVMDLVGSALDEYGVTAPLIAICPWAVVKDKDKLLAAHDDGRACCEYTPGPLYKSDTSALGGSLVAVAASSAAGFDATAPPPQQPPPASRARPEPPSSLQPNHDYFVFVDQPVDDRMADEAPDSVVYGADIGPRAKIENACVEFRSVSSVLLVVAGGKGTFEQVRSLSHALARSLARSLSFSRSLSLALHLSLSVCL